MWSELTPNDLLRKLPFKVLGDKPLPSEAEVRETACVLPLPQTKGFDRTRILGTGDWGASISSGHSVVVDYGEFVAKIPMRRLDRDCFQLAAERQGGVKHFPNSPKTLVIIAADSEGRPKPVIVQKRIKGTPVCETPFINLLRTETLLGLKSVLREAYGVYEKTGLFDFVGQRFHNKTVARLIGLHPFFSDNILVDAQGKVEMVDNILDVVAYDYSKERSRRKRLRSLRLNLILGSIDLLVAVSQLGKPEQRSKQIGS